MSDLVGRGQRPSMQASHTPWSWPWRSCPRRPPPRGAAPCHRRARRTAAGTRGQSSPRPASVRNCTGTESKFCMKYQDRQYRHFSYLRNLICKIMLKIISIIQPKYLPRHQLECREIASCSWNPRDIGRSRVPHKLWMVTRSHPYLVCLQLNEMNNVHIIQYCTHAYTDAPSHSKSWALRHTFREPVRICQVLFNIFERLTKPVEVVIPISFIA